MAGPETNSVKACYAFYHKEAEQAYRFTLRTSIRFAGMRDFKWIESNVLEDTSNAACIQLVLLPEKSGLKPFTLISAIVALTSTVMADWSYDVMKWHFQFRPLPRSPAYLDATFLACGPLPPDN